MSTQYKKSGRGGSRRSGRRSNRGGNSRPDSGPGTSGQNREPAAKAGLWQKLVALFTGEKPQATTYRQQRQEQPREPSAEARPQRQRQAPRKPESVEVTSPRIYVGNLSYDAGESDLFDLFSGVGLVQNVEVVSNKHTQRSKGFAFVQMQTIEEAKRAVEELHDKEYMGRKLLVSGAKAQEERRGDRESADTAPAAEPEQ